MKTGAAFPDFITSQKPREAFRHFDKKQKELRGFLIPVFLVAVLLFLFFRIFNLQILQGSYYRNLSDSNRIKSVIVYAPRGVVLDRNGTPLVFNVPGFRETINGKTKIIDQSEAINLLAQGKKDLEIDTLRSYPYKDVFSHVLGFIGQISKEELSQSRFLGYRGGDLVGKMGIEQEYEHILKGVDGKQLVETDSLGREVRKLGKKDPIAGTDIYLTLDAGLQKTAFEAMQGAKKGALIVSKPNGEILAMVSKPSFDPNLLTLGASYKLASSSSYQTVEQVLSDSENQPFLNRAIAGVYPPGSTFKLVVAASGLKNKIIDENYQVEDTGILHVGDFSFSNWYFSQYGRTDGMVNIVKGIKRSNDIFFYKLSEQIGVDKISQMAWEFGLGKKLGIDIEGESAGTVPTPLWKEKTIGEPWFLGDTYHYGIGQGYVLTTPLQVLGWTQAIANGGTLYKPHLLKSIKPEVMKSNFLDQHTSSLIKEGMIESCSPGGVAWPLFEFKVHPPAGGSKLRIDGKNILEVSGASGSADMRQVVIACKTGTAQHGGENTSPHAWITLFAPAYNPEIVVTVLVEESGEGSNVAAPIAKKILEDYFSRK